MRLYIATITANTQVSSGLHLIEMHAPQLAQGTRAGQFCMVRCCDVQASDPLLRRPFFLHSTQRDQGLCRLLVRQQGRGTSWLCRQPVGAELDMLGPLGHGWTIRPTVRNLLLVSEGTLLVALAMLAQTAIEQEVAVTLVAQFQNAGEIYPPALLPAEVEYHIVTGDGSVGEGGDIVSELNAYLAWADAACCAVERETAAELYKRYERLRAKHFAQGVVTQPLVCGSGACLTCSVETYSGPKLVCKEGPVFDLRDIAR